MKLQNIKIADTKKSAINSKGRTEGPAFDDLIASIKENSWGSASWDYQGAVKEMAKKLDTVGKLRLAFEFLIDTGYDSLREGIGKI